MPSPVKIESFKTIERYSIAITIDNRNKNVTRLRDKAERFVRISIVSRNKCNKYHAFNVRRI